MKLVAIFIAMMSIIAGCATLSRHTPDLEALRSQVHKLSMQYGSGSGVVLRPGFVLTADHVLELKGLQTMADGDKGVPIAAGDPKLDLGLLYFPQRDAECPCVKLADHDATMDEPVWIVGYPLGITEVVTYGASQGVMDHVLINDDQGVPEDIGRRLVLTTPAQPGNSGGGAFVFRNGEWQLVGIVVQVTGTPGGSMTFAIPASDIRRFLKDNSAALARE